MGKLSLVTELVNLWDRLMNWQTKQRLALQRKHPRGSSSVLRKHPGGFAVSVASLCVFALTRRSLRLGGLRKATMGGSGKMFLRRSDMCKRCMLALSIRLSVLRLGWYVVTNGTLSVFPFCLYVSRLVRSRSFALSI